MGNEGYAPIPKAVKVGVAAVAALVILFIVYAMFTTRVSAGQACTITHFGKPVGEAGPGIHFKVPLRDKYNCLSSRKQVYEIVADQNGGADGLQTDSKAEYVDWGISGKTSEGIDFMQFATVQYHVPVTSVRTVWENNARSNERVKEQIVKFHTRALMPQILNTYTAEQLYIGDLRPISDIIGAELAKRFTAQGIVLDYFELKRGDFDNTYEDSIRERALKVEQAKGKALDQQIATAEAERLRIEREGQKAATIIDAEATAEQVRIDAQAKADAQEIQAKGDAAATDIRGKALAANPSVIEWERIQVLRSANVIYLPSDTIIPLLPLDNKQ